MYHHHRHVVDTSKFWVVATVSNPARYRSRYALLERFRTAVNRAGANLMLVEVTLGDRPPEVMGPGDLRLYTRDEIWQKECALNLGVSRLPSDWRYVAWIDADVEFVNPEWKDETVEALQHHSVVQMFRTAVDLGPEGQALNTHRSFAAAYAVDDVRAAPKTGSGAQGYPQHPGYAWAMRRDAWNSVGGLFDTAILGSADHHMAGALIGRVHEFRPPGISPAYRRRLDTWQDRAAALHKDLGVLEGTLLHHWHGPKAARKYRDRWKILLHHGYDPDQDLQRDWQLLHRLSARGERLRRDLRAYLHSRREDDVCLL
jgi:hypothetical protein